MIRGGAVLVSAIFRGGLLVESLDLSIISAIFGSRLRRSSDLSLLRLFRIHGQLMAGLSLWVNDDASATPKKSQAIAATGDPLSITWLLFG
jgi:hypothetical protein